MQRQPLQNRRTWPSGAQPVSSPMFLQMLMALAEFSSGPWSRAGMDDFIQGSGFQGPNGVAAQSHSRVQGFMRKPWLKTRFCEFLTSVRMPGLHSRIHQTISFQILPRSPALLHPQQFCSASAHARLPAHATCNVPRRKCACLTQRPGQSATELDGLGPQHLALAAQAMLFLHRRDALLVLAMAVVRSRATEILSCSSQPLRRLQTGGLCMAFFLGRSPAAFRLHGMSPSPGEPGPWLRARSSGCVAGPGGLCAT